MRVDTEMCVTDALGYCVLAARRLGMGADAAERWALEVWGTMRRRETRLARDAYEDCARLVLSVATEARARPDAASGSGTLRRAPGAAGAARRADP